MKPAAEASVLSACLAYLRWRGIPAWRINTAGVRRRDRTGREFWAFNGTAGVADILGALPPSGRLLAVECKRPGGRLSPAQGAFLDSVRAAGGLAVVAFDVADLQRALDGAA